MQKILMMSESDGCIFTAPLSERILSALESTKSIPFSIDNAVVKLHYVDDSFYLAFRSAITDFHVHSTLVGFIQGNMGKTILVGEFSNKQYPIMKVEQILEFLRLINTGIEFDIAYQQIFG